MNQILNGISAPCGGWPSFFYARVGARGRELWDQMFAERTIRQFRIVALCTAVTDMQLVSLREGLNNSFFVMPTQAGIQYFQRPLDFRFRGNDIVQRFLGYKFERT